MRFFAVAAIYVKTFSLTTRLCLSKLFKSFETKMTSESLGQDENGPSRNLQSFSKIYSSQPTPAGAGHF